MHERKTTTKKGKYLNFFILHLLLLLSSLTVQVNAQCNNVEFYDLRGVPGFAQTDNLTVCGEADTLALLVFTDSEDPLYNAKLTVNLPTGMEYAGFELVSDPSVSTIALLDASLLNTPEFALGQLDMDHPHIVYIGVQTTCEYADDPQPLIVSYDLEYFHLTPGQEDCVESYEVEEEFNSSTNIPVLNMLSVAPTSLTFTSVGQTITQTIVLSQDGLNAYLNEFHYELSGVDLSGALGLSDVRINGTSSTNYLYDPITQILEMDIGGADFLANGIPNIVDEIMQTNEQVTIELDYTFNSCPDAAQYFTKHVAWYGCSEDACVGQDPLDAVISLTPSSAAEGEATMTVFQQPGMCGEDLILDWSLSSGESDPLLGLFRDLEIALRICNSNRLNVHTVEIGGTVIPASAWSVSGTLLNFDFNALGSDPDVGGLSDYDMDGLFNDLEGGEVITGRIHASLACGSDGCETLSCSISEMVIKSTKRDCGNEFSSFPTISPAVTMGYGPTASSTNMDDSDGDDIPEINVSTPNPWNGGTPATEFTVQHGYAFDITGITNCPNPTTYLEVSINGPDTVIADIEFTLGSATWDGTAIPDGDVSLVRTAPGQKILTIMAGDENNATEKLYQYNLEVNDCLSPTRYLTMSSKVVQGCTDAGCSCTIIKSCEQYVVQIDYPGCGLPCALSNSLVVKRKSLGYTDPSMTSRITEADLTDPVDLFRYLNHDTITVRIATTPTYDNLQLDSVLNRIFLSQETLTGSLGSFTLQYKWEVDQSTLKSSFYDADGGGGAGSYITPSCTLESQSSQGYEGVDNPAYNGRWYADAHSDHMFLVKHDPCMSFYPDTWNVGDTLILEFEAIIMENDYLTLGCDSGEDQAFVSGDSWGVRRGDVLSLLPDWGSDGINCNRPLIPIYFDCQEVNMNTAATLEDCTDTYEHTFTVGGVDPLWYQDEFRPVFQIEDLQSPFVGATYLIEGTEEVVSFNPATGNYDLVTPISSSGYDANTNCQLVSGTNYCYSDPIGAGHILFDETGLPQIGFGQGHTNQITVRYDVGKLCPYEASFTEYTVPWGFLDNYCDVSGVDTMTFVQNGISVTNNTSVIADLIPSLTTQIVPAIGATQTNTYTVLNSGANPGGTPHDNVGHQLTVPNNIGLVSITEQPGGLPITPTVVNNTPTAITYFFPGPLSLAPQASAMYDIETELLYCPAGLDVARIELETYSGCIPAADRGELLIGESFDGANNCASAKIQYLYELYPSELQSQWFDVPTTTDLCSELYLSIQLNNVRVGLNTNQEYTIWLPTQGFEFVPGFTEFAYPHGPVVKNSWTSVINDLTRVAALDNAYGDAYTINIADIDAYLSANGLSGISATTATTDSNKVALRFKVKTACDFISGSTARYKVTGEDNCGNPTPVDVKQTAPIVVNGADPADYAQFLFFAEPSDISCGLSTVTVKGINISPTGTTDASSKGEVILPPLLAYQTATFQVSAPAGFTANQVESTDAGGNTVINFDVPPGITKNGVLAFTFDTSLPNSMECGEIPIKVSVNTEVQGIICQETMTPCTVYVENSINSTIDLELTAPFVAENIAIYTDCPSDDDNTTLYYEYTINHMGADVVNQPFTINLFVDSDGNTLVTPDIDELAGTTTGMFSVSDNSSVTVTGTVVVPTYQSCPLVFELSYGSTCGCDRQEEFINNISSKALKDIDGPIAMCEGACFDLELCESVEFNQPDSIKGATGILYELEIDWNRSSPYTLPSPNGVAGITAEAMQNNSILPSTENALIANYPDDDLAYMIAHYDAPVAVDRFYLGGGLIAGWSNVIEVYTSGNLELEYSMDGVTWINSGHDFTGADGPFIQEEILPNTIIGQHFRLFKDPKHNWATSEFRLEGEPIPYTNPTISQSGSTVTICLNDGVGVEEPLVVSFETGTGGCSVTETIEINNITDLEVDAGKDKGVCEGTCTKLNLSLPANAAAGATVLWTPSDFLDDPTDFNPEVCDLDATTTYTATVTFPGGCEKMDDVTLFFQPAPTGVAGGDDDICDSGTDTAILTSAPGFSTYQWYMINPGTPDLFVSGEEEYVATAPGDYYVVYSVPEACPFTSPIFTVSEIQCGTIGDYIGNNDSGDPIENVMVILYDDMGNPLDTAYTDAAGNYLFDNLPAGDYTITVDPSNFDTGGPLEGLDQLVDPDGGMDNSSAVTLAAGEDNLDQDFEYGALGSIGDYVWNTDTNDPIQGVLVVLYDDMGNPLDSAYTDIDGNYLFDDLPTGDYSVTIDPINFDAGGPLEDMGNSSDPDGGLDSTSDVSLAPGEDNLDQDFGYESLGSIGDLIVNDDTGDPIENVMVVLYDDMGNPLDTAYTDAMGNYLFDDLPAGDYVVTVDPTNFDPGNPLEGFDNSTDPDGGNDNSSAVSLAAGEDNLDQDFGYMELGSIGDYVWEDLNGDGVQDGSEDPIAGVMVVLYDDMGNPLDTAYTDMDGLYLFDDLPAGEYTISIDPSSFDPGAPLEAYGQTFDADGGTDNSSTYDLAAGEDNTDQDFGYEPLGSIGDLIVNDDTGAPIAGVMVVLYDDMGIPLDTAYTDAMGNYLFDDLPAGDYAVTVDPSNFDAGNPLEGFGNSTDPDGGFDNTSAVTLAAGEDNLDQDFGYEELGSIGDYIWEDLNGNGVQDGSEDPIAGVMVVLYDDMGNPLDTAYTDMDGLYLFDELPAGDYTVTVDPSNYDSGSPLEDYAQTFDADGGTDDSSSVTLGAGEDNLDQDFGYEPLGSIGDTIINDNTGVPIAGVMVVLYDDMGNPLDTAYTDAMGLYLFDDLPADDYVVTVDPTNFDAGNPLEGLDNSTDPDGGNDNTSAVTLGAGEDNLDQDFGYMELGSIGDTVLNNDTGDPIAGVMVVLYDDMGNPLDTAYTDALGMYLFDDLPADDYLITIDPSNFDAGNPLEGLTNNVDPDGGNDNTSVVTLGVGEDNLDQDFEYIELGSIGDYIWNDDYNTPIAGVMVVLYDDMGNPLDTAYTDFTGMYLFDDLPADDYVVAIDPTNFNPGSPLFGLDNVVDPDGGLDNTSAVTLGAGEDNLDQDFGYSTTGSIGDTILNNDLGDPIAGVMVVLYDDLGNPLDTAYTDALGQYLFDDLPAGDYTVTVDPSNFDAGNPLEGLDNVVDPDGGLDNTSAVTLGVGEDNLDQDFEYGTTGSIGDSILNNDTGGPIAGVMVVLYDDMGNPLDTAYTNATGTYLFDDLPAGNYVVTVDPTNFDAGNPLEGLGNVVDPDGGNDSSSAISLEAGENDLDQDFEYAELGSIGDYIWNDATNMPIENVMVVLYDDLGNPIDTAYTDSAGNYRFGDLPQGEYTITVDPSNFLLGNPLEGLGNVSDPDGNNDNSSTYILGPGEENSDQIFGYDLALPLELVAFKGTQEGCDHKLEWSTSTEIDVRHFEIQYSRDGENYEAIGKVDAIGNSVTLQNYSFINTVSARTNYYRLKMVDLDGSFEFSDVIILQSECAEIGIYFDLYPNPVSTEKLYIQFNSELAGSSQLQILDALGRVVISTNVKVEEGFNRKSINVEQLAAGNYFLYFSFENGLKTTKKFSKITN